MRGGNTLYNQGMMKQGRMQIRFAEQTDLPTLMDLVNRAFVVEKSFKYNDRLNPEQTQEHFDRGRFFLAEYDGKPVGSIYLELRGERAYFGLLAVDPARQGQGIGRRLISIVEQYAREQGAKFMDMAIVDLRTELPAFYERLGYKACGSGEIPPEVIGPLRMPCRFIQYSRPLSSEDADR